MSNPRKTCVLLTGIIFNKAYGASYELSFIALCCKALMTLKKYM